MRIVVKREGPNFGRSQSTTPTAMAAGYVRREETQSLEVVAPWWDNGSGRVDGGDERWHNVIPTRAFALGQNKIGGNGIFSAI